MPPRKILGQRIEKDFHGAKDFVPQTNQFIWLSFSVLKQPGAVLWPMIWSGPPLVFLAASLQCVLLIVAAKTKRFRDAGGKSMIPLRHDNCSPGLLDDRRTR